MIQHADIIDSNCLFPFFSYVTAATPAVTPYCIWTIEEVSADDGTGSKSNNVDNSTLVQLTHNSFVERVRFSVGYDTNPVGVLLLKESTVSTDRGYYLYSLGSARVLFGSSLQFEALK